MGRKTRSGELFETRLRERGAPVALELVVRRPEGAGPFPLVVFNHGSTGDGTNRRLIRETVEYAGVTRHFNARGWAVIYPQRRGRGKSEGTYDEGLEADAAKGYSCDAAVALRGLDRAVEDVDAVMECVAGLDGLMHDRVIMAGVSRGGALAVAYAGHAPDAVAGVVNVSGGWLGRRCADTYEGVNRAAFLRGAPFGGPTLWLCGTKDPYYRVSHCRSVHEAFVEAGGRGRFESVAIGHNLITNTRLWIPHVDRFLAEIAP